MISALLSYGFLRHMTQNNLENETSYKIPWKITTLFKVAFFLSTNLESNLFIWTIIFFLTLKYAIQYTSKYWIFLQRKHFHLFSLQICKILLSILIC